MTGVLKALVDSDWVPVGGQINLPAGAKSDRSITADNLGPTSGTTEYTIKTMTIPATGVSGTLHLYASVLATKSVATDRFNFFLYLDSTFITQYILPYGSGVDVLAQTAAPQGGFETDGTTNHTFRLAVTRAAGTGTLTFSSALTATTMQWIFIPFGDSSPVDWSELDARYVNVTGDVVRRRDTRPSQNFPANAATQTMTASLTAIENVGGVTQVSGTYTVPVAATYAVTFNLDSIVAANAHLAVIVGSGATARYKRQFGTGNTGQSATYVGYIAPTDGITFYVVVPSGGASFNAIPSIEICRLSYG